MKKDQQYIEHEINAPVSSSQSFDEPKSAHSTPVTEKYVKKRKAKAEKQTNDEHKTGALLNI